MTKSIRILLWLSEAILGALALGTIALHRGEQINAMWLVIAALCDTHWGTASIASSFRLRCWRSMRNERLPPNDSTMAVPTWFVGATRLLLATFREIFDESAYSRFLSRHEMSSCPSAYAVFLREQEGIKARRPKCC